MNNRGSSLVMIVIIMLFVAVISSLILTVTVRSFLTAKVKAKAEKSFYTAEEAMDTVKARLEQYADEAAALAYTEWLEEYSLTSDTADRKASFYAHFERELNNLVETRFMNGTNSEYYGSMFSSIGTETTVRWLSGNKDPNDTYDGDGDDDIYVDAGTLNDDGVVTVKNLGIRFTNSDGTSTDITTSVRLTIAYPDFKIKLPGRENPANDFVMIADGNIRNELSGGTTNITGNVYAGGEGDVTTGAQGICFLGNGTKVILTADRVITRKALSAYDGATFTIKGNHNAFSFDYGYKSSIWAGNVLLDLSNNVSGSLVNKMDITGDIYLSDDLTLNSDGASFKLKGNYYGYSVNNATADDANRNGTPEGSSAILINGKDAELDMTNCDVIWVAGKAFLTVPGNSTALSFVEGESLTVRGLQTSYLVPGELLFLTTTEGGNTVKNPIGHNPMDSSEISDINDVTVDFNVYREATGVDVAKYLDVNEPVKHLSVIYRVNNKVHELTYFFYNFRNHDNAREYFSHFYDTNESLVKSRMNMLGNGKILVNADALSNTGNVITYEKTGSVKHVDMIDGEDDYASSKYVSEESKLSSKFEALCTTLTETGTGAAPQAKLTESLVYFDRIPYDGEELEFTWTDEEGSHKYRLITCDGDLAISGSLGSYNGEIVIATGNVTVGTAPFKGLIIAGGDIILNGSSNIVYDPDSVGYLVSTYSEVGKYFVNTGVGTSGSSVTASDIISVQYEGFKKN